MPPKKKYPKLRPLIHSSYTHFISKLYDSEYGLTVAGFRSLQEMVDEVKAEATRLFGNDQPIGLTYNIDQVEYTLRRFKEMHEAGTLRGNEDVSIFADALKVRFKDFVEGLESIDSEPI